MSGNDEFDKIIEDLKNNSIMQIKESNLFSHTPSFNGYIFTKDKKLYFHNNSRPSFQRNIFEIYECDLSNHDYKKILRFVRKNIFNLKECTSIITRDYTYGLGMTYQDINIYCPNPSNEELFTKAKEICLDIYNSTDKKKIYEKEQDRS